MPQYKLTYFDIRARGEVIRMMFILTDTPFEDNRIQFEDWFAKVKPTLKFGQLPILEVDGKQMTQTFAIARYLARQFGLAGKNDWESYECDQLAGIFEDLYAYVRTWREEKNEDKKKEIRAKLDGMAGVMLDFLEEKLKNNPSGYLVGNDLTWMDLEAGERILFYKTDYPALMEGRDNLVQFMNRVHAHPKLAEYIKNRKY